MFLRNAGRLTLGLHCVVSQKTELSVTTAVSISKFYKIFSLLEGVTSLHCFHLQVQSYGNQSARSKSGKTELLDINLAQCLASHHKSRITLSRKETGTSPPSMSRSCRELWEPRRLTALWASTALLEGQFSGLGRNIRYRNSRLRRTFRRKKDWNLKLDVFDRYNSLYLQSHVHLAHFFRAYWVQYESQSIQAPRNICFFIILSNFPLLVAFNYTKSSPFAVCKRCLVPWKSAMRCPDSNTLLR
jgi:hypothetical protein